MLRKEYSFTHNINGIPYDFVINILGATKTLSINGVDVYPASNSHFVFVDKQGCRHDLTIKTNVIRSVVFIDGLEYDYIGSSMKGEVFLMFMPFILAVFQGFFLTPINIFVNRYILRTFENPTYKTALTIVATLALSFIGIFVLWC